MPNAVMVSVAIESSKGRFKAYFMSYPHEHINHSLFQKIAAYGNKVRKPEAEKIFPFTAAKYEFEG